MIELLLFSLLVAVFLYLLNRSSPNTTNPTNTTTSYNPSNSPQVSIPHIPKNINPLFKAIGDNFLSYEQLQQAIREAGLENSNIIIGIDFTKSNTWTGAKTFNGKCLHDLIPNMLNPYQTVISVLGRTLSAFDDDNLIPVYGFGDSVTTDKRVFPLQPEPCQGFDAVLQIYSQIVPHIKLSGPTSFAPLIYETIKIVRKSKAYHILVIIADGQVTNEKETIDAIVACSQFPISIIMIGVGDGPWDTMRDFDDRLPHRQFDNFQFVPFHETIMKNYGNEILFARDALMEIPDQYKLIKSLNLISIT